MLPEPYTVIIFFFSEYRSNFLDKTFLNYNFFGISGLEEEDSVDKTNATQKKRAPF